MSSSSIDRPTLRSLIAVLTHLNQQESHSNQKEILSAAIDRVWECYDGDQFPVSPDSITASDVETAYLFLETHSPTRAEAATHREEHGSPHPNRPFSHGLGFVDTASRYAIGSLPSFRNWTATYIHNGEPIAERTYDYEDSIKLTPVIDDVRYKADSTERDPDGTVRVYLSKRPFRSAIDVFIHHHADQGVKIEGHNGPNVADNAEPVSTLEAEFDAERTGDSGVVVTEDIEAVVDFVESQGWEYADDDQLLK